MTKRKPQPEREESWGLPGDLAEALRCEMRWLSRLIDARIRHYFRRGRGPAVEDVLAAAPRHPPASSRYADLLANVAAGSGERVLLALALAPHVAPQHLDVFFLRHERIERGFTEFGGLKGTHHAGFLPTGETVLFVLCGDDVRARLAARWLFDPAHPLRRNGVIRLGPCDPDEPAWAGAVSLAPGCFEHLVSGEPLIEPEPDPAFPARRITTPLTRADLVLDEQTLAQVDEIKAWAIHGAELRMKWGLGRLMGPGYRVLFHGASGTGKTLTASLLGQELGREVYRVDLSQVVSKYIGETEKNLAAVFTRAEQRGWILFFDEADALFGKRTRTSSAHDRYANQEVAYLLQRVEEHAGIVVLASNLKSNLDEAFARRFQQEIYFAPPNEEQRLQLWEKALAPPVELAAAVDLAWLARDHEITGGQIINVVRHACVMAVQRKDQQVRLDDVVEGIRREEQKAGRGA